MTTRNASTARPDVQSIATAVAADLPGVWSIACSRHGDHLATLTRDADGLAINISHDRAYNAPADRLCIGQDYHTAAWVDGDGNRTAPTGYGERLPSINVTAKKRPTIIAREIVRRLLADAERFHAVGVKYVAGRNSAQCERDRLAALLGMDSATRSRWNGRTENPSETHELADAHPDANYPRAQVEASSSGVGIKLDGLTAAQARAVLAAVGVELPAPGVVAA